MVIKGTQNIMSGIKQDLSTLHGRKIMLVGESFINQKTKKKMRSGLNETEVVE